MKNFLITIFAGLALFITGCSSSEEPETQPEKKKLEITLTRSESEALKSINSFAFDLFKATNTEKVKEQEMQKGYNYLISPFGASMALGMLANGAQGETLKEITDMLKIGDSSLDDLNECSRTLINAFTAPENQIAMKVTNHLHSNNYQIQPNYLSKVGEFYNAIQTNDEDECLNGEKLDFAIIDVIEFQGRWDEVFNKDKTESGIFRNADATEGEVYFMNMEQTAFVAEDDKCRILSKGMDKGSFSFYFILPSGDNTIEDVICQLDQDYWEKIAHGFKRYSVNISIPKFKLEEDETFLNDPVKSLGMVKAFDKRNAELPDILMDMNSLPICPYIEVFKQRSSINVDEEGAEIKVVTIIGMMGSAYPFEKTEFILDRPFIYVISENSTGAILFMGKVSRFKDFELY